MTEAEERLLWSWSQGLANAEPDLVRQAVVSALDEVHRLRRGPAVAGRGPGPGEGEQAGKAEAPAVATLRIAPDETAPYWRGKAQALEDEVGRLVGLVRLLARDPD